MNHLKRYRKQLSNIVFLLNFLPGLVALAVYAGMREYLELEFYVALGVSLLIYALVVIMSYKLIMNTLMQPIEKIWQAVWHISPGKENVAAPKLDNINIGRELITNLIMEIYNLASSGSNLSNDESGSPAPQLYANSLLEQLPISVLVLDKEYTVKSINQTAMRYIEKTSEKIIGNNVYDVMHLSFLSEDTLENWLNDEAKQKATATKSWEHVRLHSEDQKTIKQFDLAASYSKDNSEGNEVVLAIFDRTATYSREDEATSYVALAVHELRTPLTVLRGYIEVFDDELGSQLSPEHREFMRKMSAAAQSLTAFVSNILNVARVQENQLVLSLREADWNKLLPEIIKDLELRASVRGKTLELDIAEDLPKVAIDKVSMYEVISNLIDNAIKYSGNSPKVIVHASAASDGSIETVIQDFGVGIPEGELGNLFTKFYRSHRSKSAVTGSGLGLYLVKAIVSAHGGKVWVNSKEGEGSKFGFSLQPYSAISEGTNQDGIERQASGWIKNHSLYRR
jgi:signal transduction histidine kinase